MKGATPSTPGARRTFATSGPASGIPATVSPNSTTCASVPAMRLWISFSKPFITASTVSSAVTPSATPPIEMPVSSVMKPLCRRVRR